MVTRNHFDTFTLKPIEGKKQIVEHYLFLYLESQLHLYIVCKVKSG